MRPDQALGMGIAAARWGMTPAAAVAAVAAATPERVAVDDGREVLSYGELDRRSSELAAGLLGIGVGPGERVALLARNSARFLLAQLAVVKLGADLLYLNTGFAGRQLRQVLDDEDASVLILDGEFAELTGGPGRPVICTGADPAPPGVRTLDDLNGGAGPLPAWDRPGRQIILTSGTTGRPKGAPRDSPGRAAGFSSLMSLLSAIPLRAEGVTVLAAPMFHAWGSLHLALGGLLGSTLILRRRFDPLETLQLLDEHRADALVAVPVMIQRMLDLPEDALAVALPALRVVALSGSALPVPLAQRAERLFGPVFYDLYGSTEAGFVSVAGPADLAEAPGSVGRPLPGAQVSIRGEDGEPLPAGESGRIFAHTAMTFTGYTGGEDKDRIDGMVATGDVGHLDEDGRLWVDGRDDDMVVSGGENVFPAEVEDALREHPAVADVAVVGAPDERFGQRLVAHVVLRAEASADSLREHVRSQLAAYKVPREVFFHDSLPRNETGKVLKRELSSDDPT